MPIRHAKIKTFSPLMKNIEKTLPFQSFDNFILFLCTTILQIIIPDRLLLNPREFEVVLIVRTSFSVVFLHASKYVLVETILFQLLLIKMILFLIKRSLQDVSAYLPYVVTSCCLCSGSTDNKVH